MAEEALKVLLIEHDPGFAQTVVRLLSQARDLSAEVLSATDLVGGLGVLTRGAFDVVLLDVSVPDGAGLANIPLIKAEAPDLPVIVAGDSENETVAFEAVHAGAHDYLVKSQLTSTWLERSVRYAIERQRVDLALLDAERKYHSIFDHLSESIFQTTPDGRYLMANAALARIYGYASPDELIQTLTDIGGRLYVEPGRREEFIRLMQEHDVLRAFQSQVRRKDGSVIWISENCRAVRDARGRLLYYEGTVEDITQQRQAEEKLRHSEALYHSLVETLPQNIFRKDLALRFTFANQQFCQALGRPLQDVVGKTDFDFFPADLARKYQADDRQVLDTGAAYETIEEHQPPGGRKMFVQVVKTPLRGADGTIIGLQAIFWDITQQREAEAEIRRANADLAQSRQELGLRNEQMEDDLRMAREVQLAMLPQTYPVFPRSGPESDSAFSFTHRYLPIGSVGGDFFTVSALSETQVAVFLCDVAGHGVRSGLVTAMIRALVEELKPCATNPGLFLTKLNQDLWEILRHAGTPLLTTGFYLVADWQTGVMRYANAGHPRPLHVRRSAGQVVSLANASGKNQPALGLFNDLQYQGSEILLSAGDLILLYTDGLVEASNQKNEMFDQAHLADAVRRRLEVAAPQLFDELLAEARRFCGPEGFHDDVCLVGLDVAGGQGTQDVLKPAERTAAGKATAD